MFSLKWVALYIKVVPNSIDFYKGIFLHVIPVRIMFHGKWNKTRKIEDVIEFLKF